LEEDDITRFTLRLPNKMREVILEKAKANRRSLHAEILVLLQEGLDAQEGKLDPKESRHETVNQVAA
jgi:hypothetical protein